MWGSAPSLIPLHCFQVVVAHADCLSDLEYLNTVHESGDHWQKLTSLPEMCGLNGVAISGYRTKVQCNANSSSQTDTNPFIHPPNSNRKKLNKN